MTAWVAKEINAVPVLVEAAFGVAAVSATVAAYWRPHASDFWFLDDSWNFEIHGEFEMERCSHANWPRLLLHGPILSMVEPAALAVKKAVFCVAGGLRPAPLQVAAIVLHVAAAALGRDRMVALAPRDALWREAVGWSIALWALLAVHVVVQRRAVESQLHRSGRWVQRMI